ncbi:MAG: glycine--tRNA ligase [Nanoarchaeota archaeon]|nr:glycine--tRNA ligase [Nanoarchaeota archaeon]MBU1703952.1 glycine--tRNA ligase [Nanoarchaeota archaeon]
MALTIEDMAIFCKKKGFIFPNSEIYGGIAGFFDYGPLGVELKNNIKQSWWKTFVQDRDDVVGIDGTTITHPKVWKASGHVDCFGDIMLECTKCKERFRGDHLIQDVLKIQADGLSKEDIDKLVIENKIHCTKCKSPLGPAHEFNLMFTTQVGPVVTEESKTYLRPETAQLIFADFKAVMDTSRQKLPFGIAQSGRAYRNEISPRDFLFRSREFEQMEIEFFIHPKETKCALLSKEDLDFEFQILTQDNQEKNQSHSKIKAKDMIKNKVAGEWHVYWLRQVYQWFIDMGIKKENLRLREHLKDELAHYSSACFDIEYQFPSGWKEIHGNANRGQFDLQQHEKVSKKSMAIFDEATQEKVIPRVIEPSQGTDRAFLAVMFDAYEDDKERGNIVLKLSPRLSPIKVAVLPLVNKLEDEAKRIYNLLKKEFTCIYDRSGSVGRRYARADEIGIPYCITVDFEGKDDKTVTIRYRDNTKQVRVKIDDLIDTINNMIKGKYL